MELEEKNGVEDVTKSDILELATWNRERTAEQLRDFITRREAALADVDNYEE